MLTDAKHIFVKDMTIERRSREVAFTMVAFGLLATLIFALSFFIDKDTARGYAPGVFGWACFLAEHSDCSASLSPNVKMTV